jgi:hypothetical protein
MKDLGMLEYVLGMEVIQDPAHRTIKLNQTNYIKQLLKKFDLQDSKSVSTPMDSRISLSKSQCPTTEGEKLFMQSKSYREAVGSLLWVSNGTRPDISYAVNQVARYMENPGVQHWDAVQRILVYLRGSQNKSIVFESDENSATTRGYYSYPKANAQFYVDADHATNKDDRRSVTGYTFVLAGGPVSWQSKTQPTVALSSMEAEYMAACSATQEALWLAMLLEQMSIQISKPIVLNEDNQSCVEFSRNPGNHQRSKHIDTKYHFVRERVAAGDIVLRWIPTTEQIADIFTKALDAADFCRLREYLVRD